MSPGGITSQDFPTTPGVYQREFKTGGTSLGSGGLCEAFVAKFSPAGQLIWSTHLGGPNYDKVLYATYLGGAEVVTVPDSQEWR